MCCGDREKGGEEKKYKNMQKNQESKRVREDGSSFYSSECESDCSYEQENEEVKFVEPVKI